MAAKSGKTEIFPHRHRILLYYPAGQKFAQNRSISYHFEDIFNVSFSAKIQDGRQKCQKLKNFPLCIGYSCTTLRVKNSLKIALCLTVFEIFTLFHFHLKNSLEIALSRTVFEIFTFFNFPQKSKMAAKSGEN